MKGVHSEIEALREAFKNLFKTQRARQQEHIRKDLEEVMTASRLLQISEFRFFNLAYAQWYGHDISEKGLEHIFASYMFEDIVPHWVRHFTRKVLSLFEQGVLDPEMFHIERPVSTLEKRSEGIGYTIILVILLVVFCFLLTSGSTPH